MTRHGYGYDRDRDRDRDDQRRWQSREEEYRRRYQQDRERGELERFFGDEDRDERRWSAREDSGYGRGFGADRGRFHGRESSGGESSGREAYGREVYGRDYGHEPGRDFRGGGRFEHSVRSRRSRALLLSEDAGTLRAPRRGKDHGWQESSMADRGARRRARGRRAREPARHDRRPGARDRHGPAAHAACAHGTLAAMATVLFPLPDRDFDVTEVAVPWKLLREAGHEPVFATEGGGRPACDPLLLSGVVFGKLGARPDAIACYRELEQAAEFAAPRRWADCSAGGFDALFLAGGHAPGMRQYLGSEVVQQLVAAFFATDKPIAAICHGVLVAARAKRADGHSVLHGLRTTCLPKYMERAAVLATFWRRGRYYRTYPAYVEEEVRAALARPEDFEHGPRELSRRGTREDDRPAFVVEDGRYVSARWPGDAYLIAKKLIERLPAAMVSSRAV